MTTHALLALVHLIGLALAVGSATVKVALLLRCRGDITFAAHYIQVSPVVTRLIVSGLAILTLSGAAWMVVLGQGFTGLMITKLILVGLVWVMGPLIDKVIEPRFTRLVVESSASPSEELARAHRQFLSAEAATTGSFYVTMLLGVLL